VSRKNISPTTKKKIRSWAKDRCSYCLSAQKYVYVTLHIEHIIPVVKGGTDGDNNLCLSCVWCNLSKSTKTEGLDPRTKMVTRLFNPRSDLWAEHFEWDQDQITLKGKTAIGRTTVEELNMNRSLALQVRKNWVIAGWHP